MHQFSRNELAIGQEGLDVLKGATVIVVGMGGVGSHATEALARSGVGTLVLIDKDTIDITNINRQLPALLSTVGQEKAVVMKQRITDINPDCQVHVHSTFINEENISLLFDYKPDFIVDAIDTIKIKGLIMKEAVTRNVPIISSMGMSNKMDPTQIKIVNLWDTKYDPIARVLRRMMRDAKLTRKKIMVVCSEEIPVQQRDDVVQELSNPDSSVRKAQLPPSSNGFVPSVSGIFCASYVINTLLKKNKVIIHRLHGQG